VNRVGKKQVVSEANGDIEAVGRLENDLYDDEEPDVELEPDDRVDEAIGEALKRLSDPSLAQMFTDLPERRDIRDFAAGYSISEWTNNDEMKEFLDRELILRMSHKRERFKSFIEVLKSAVNPELRLRRKRLGMEQELVEQKRDAI